MTASDDVIVVRRLSPRTSPGRLRAIDRVLAEARSALVHPGEALAPAAERAQDAEGDATRLLFYARLAGRTAGIADATLHAPAPGDVFVAQIAVAARARGRGVGRALVGAVLARARAVMSPGAGIYAAVRPGNTRAVAFWEHLGLVVVEQDRRSIVLRAPAEDVAARLGSGD